MNHSKVQSAGAWVLLLAAAGLGLGPARATACSICGCGDPLQAAGDARPEGGELRFGLLGEYLARSTARSSDDPQRMESMTQTTLRFLAFYSPSDRLKLALFVPVVRKDARAAGGEALAERSVHSGLGDVEAGLRWFLWEQTEPANRVSRNLSISGGSSVPTGRNNLRLDGQRVDDHEQPGTGAWGPYAGLQYGARALHWTLTADMTDRARTVNRFGYRFGNALLWDLEAQWKPASNPGATWAVGAALEGRMAWKDRADGEEVANTGGAVWNVTPTLWLNPGGEVALYLRVQVPVATNLFGMQTVGTTTKAGMQFGWN